MCCLSSVNKKTQADLDQVQLEMVDYQQHRYIGGKPIDPIDPHVAC